MGLDDDPRSRFALDVLDDGVFREGLLGLTYVADDAGLCVAIDTGLLRVFGEEFRRIAEVGFLKIDHRDFPRDDDGHWAIVNIGVCLACAALGAFLGFFCECAMNFEGFTAVLIG